MLVFVASASALDWWVADPEAVEPTRAALAELWPAGPFVLRQGEHLGYGAWYAEGTLHLDLPDGVREGPAPADPVAQVVLARAWLRELGPDRVAPPARWRPQIGVMAGTGVALESMGAPLHLALDGGVTWRTLAIEAFANADLGAAFEAESGEYVDEQRLGGGVAAGVRTPLWGGEIVVSGGPTVRAVVAQAGTLQTTVLAGAVERTHWWRSVAPKWDFGVGAVIQFDGPGSSWATGPAHVGAERYHRPEVTTAVELGLAFAP